MSLLVFVKTRKQVPPTESTFRLPENIVAQVDQFEAPWNGMGLSTLLSIISAMQQADISDYLDELGRQFIQIDFDRHTDEFLPLIVQQIVGIALFGLALPLFEHLLARRIGDKRVRTILGKLKGTLERAFSKVPSGFRSNVRGILSRLEDVPVDVAG